VATFMLLVDTTIVNVALPEIQRSLHASLTNLQWVVDAFALTLAALLLTAGTLTDRFGRRAMFIAGVTVFTVASLVCGLSGSATMLNLARAAQGIGGAGMFATSLALIAQEFSGRERGTAIAAWGSTCRTSSATPRSTPACASSPWWAPSPPSPSCARETSSGMTRPRGIPGRR